MAKEEAEIKELSKKLAQNPESLVFAPLADAYRRAGKLDEAIQTCLKGLEFNPTYATARTILGRVYFEKEMFDEAISEFKKIEAADSNNTMAHSMLGQIYMRKGMFGEAINENQKVLALNPDDSVAQSFLEEALEKARRTAGEGKKTPDEAGPPNAAENGPQGGKSALSKEQLATVTVAEIYVKKGAYDEAIEVFQEILQADPENPIAKQKLKEIVELKENRAKALKESAKDKKEEENRKAEEEKKRKEEEGRKAEEEKKRKEEEGRKAEEEKKRKEEEGRKAEEDKKRKEEEGRKAEEDKKRKEEEGRKAEEEKKRKEEEGRKAEEEKKRKEEEGRKAEEDKKRKKDEAAGKKSEEDETQEKITADDIFSVMKISAPDEVILEEGGSAAKPAVVSKPAATEKAAGVSKTEVSGGGDSKGRALLEEFNKNAGIQGSLLINRDGEVLESLMQGVKDLKALGAVAATIFINTEKAVSRMRQGSLNQIIILGEDGRQIIFAQLKMGVLTAVANKSANFGLLRIALNDLVRKSA